MSDRSLQVSVEDLQHIQRHLEGQELALAAIAEHLRAFKSDAGHFVEFQSDFIKTIGLIQDVHRYTKQQANQWLEQLDQLRIVNQDTFKLQHDFTLQLDEASKKTFDELQSILQQQQQYVEQIKRVMSDHENLLSTHNSIQLFEKISDLIDRMTHQLSDTLTQTNAVIFGLSKIEHQQAQQAKRAAEKISEIFGHITLQLRQQQTEHDLKDDHHLKGIQQQIDQRFSNIESIILKLNQQYTARDTQDKNNIRSIQQHIDQRFSNIENIMSQLNQQQAERDFQDKNNLNFIQQQIDQRLSSATEIAQRNIKKIQKDQLALHEKQQRSLHIILLIILVICIVAIANHQMQAEQNLPPSDQSPPVAQKATKPTPTVSPAVWIAPKTNLMWLNCGLGQTWKAGRCEGQLTAYTWVEAQALVKAINQNGGYAGYTDWRLPYITESFTIALCRSGYTRSTNIPSRELGRVVIPSHCRLPNAPQIFWTNTVIPNSPSFAYSIDYGSATTTLASKDQRYFVTLVRYP